MSDTDDQQPTPQQPTPQQPTPQQPTPQQPTPQPTAVTRSGTSGADILTTLDVTSSSMVDAVRIGVLAYVTSWLTALVGFGLGIFADGTDGVSGWWVLTAPGQAVAMAFLSPATASYSVDDEDFGFGGELALTIPPLSVLLVAIIAVLVLSRRHERSVAARSTRGAVSLAVTSALVFVALAFLVALVLRFDAGDDVTFHAAHFKLIAYGLIIVTVASLLGRRPLDSWSFAASIPGEVRSAVRAVLVHLVVFSLLTIPTAIIWVLVEAEPSVLLVLPGASINLLLFAVTFGHLGAVSASGVGVFFGASDSGTESVWAFSQDTPTIVILLIVYAVVATVASGLVLRARGDGGPRATSHWVWTPLVFAAAGGVMTFLGRSTYGAGSGMSVGGEISFGPAAWFLLVFAVWGVLAELVARHVAPTLDGVVPARWVHRAAGRPPQEPHTGTVLP